MIETLLETIIGQKLELAVEQELTRMNNEWFFKWHFIGKDGPVEIESFRGKPICCGGIEFWGSAESVYWDTISRYRKIKVSEFFNNVEQQLPTYSKHVRQRAISEAENLIKMFSASIRRTAVEKDRILRGDGSKFPKPHDLGRWEGSGSATISTRAQGLIETYCAFDPENGGDFVIENMMTETLSFVKSDGTSQKKDVKGLVSGSKLFTFDISLPVEPKDRFLRQLPSGLVEEYIVDDPGYQAGLGGSIKPHYQATVHRNDAAPASVSTIINNIHGENARVNVNSADNSQNFAISTRGDAVFDQLRELLTRAEFGEGEHAKFLTAISEMEAAKGTPTFKDKYQEFMARAANHASVFGAAFGALALLL